MTRSGQFGLAALSALLFAFPAGARDRPAPRMSGTPALPLSRDRLASPAGPFDAPLPILATVAVADDLDLGIGMFSVTGHFIRDRGAQGREPIIGTTGRQNRVAAIGLNLRF